MLSRVSAFLVLALPLFASATAILPRTDQCSTGPIQCCNQVGTLTHSLTLQTQGLGLADDFELLGIVIDPIDAVIGVNCSPITVGGIGGNSCNAQPVCCSNNTYNGLVNVGCIVVNINA
ncbi:hydrophobin 2 [Crassisporium funariophilum]|nr:hydrophobin 2 [Crassisporium funariophilum]